MLWVVFVLAMLSVGYTVVSDRGSISDTLTVFGGILVLLGSYFAARTLRENEADRATAMLAADSVAVRVAGVDRLRSLAKETPRYRAYVQTTLAAYVDDRPASERGCQLASSTLSELAGSDDASSDKTNEKAPPERGFNESG